MSASDPIKAWHFLPDNSRTRYSDEPVELGTTLHVEDIKICERGLHASIHPLDALKYAPGFLLCWVELSGEKQQQDDKLCAQTRTVWAMRDTRRLVLEFTADVVERVFKEVGLGGADCDLVCKFVRDFAVSGSTNGIEAAQRAAWNLRARALARARALDLALDLALALARALDLALDLALALALALARDENTQSKTYAWARDEFQKRVEALFNGGAK